MAELGTVKAICEKHGYDNAPRTYKRLKDALIDCIFVSAYLKAIL